MKLKKFKKNIKQKKISILLLVIFAITLSLLIKHTYAIYQKESEVQFINATVRWPYANEISYTTTSNSSVTNVEEALNDLYGKLGS